MSANRTHKTPGLSNTWTCRQLHPNDSRDMLTDVLRGFVVQEPGLSGIAGGTNVATSSAVERTSHSPLAYWLCELGVSQGELSRRSGLSRQTISQAYRGD